MSKLIHYYAHPGHRYSKTNLAMQRETHALEGITRVDLYAEYPRHDIDIDREQARLLNHDIVIIQFPIFWYSAPSLLKEWIDLTFEHGFAYGEKGDKLANKWMMLAVTAAGPESAYTAEGHQHYPLRTFLTPFEQTARLSKMRFAAPYVFYDSLNSDPLRHASGFAQLLRAIRDDQFDFEQSENMQTLSFDALPIHTAT